MEREGWSYPGGECGCGGARELENVGRDIGRETVGRRLEVNQAGPTGIPGYFPEGVSLKRASARLAGCTVAAIAVGSALMGATPGEEGRLTGHLAVTLRGSGAAPFGIASAIFGSTNLGLNLGRLLQTAEEDGLEALERLTFQQKLPASESYGGILDFELRAMGRNRWELERLKLRYEFADHTRLEYDRASVVDAMTDSGTVSFADGRWQTPGTWKPGNKPRISLEVFKAERRDQCEDPGVNRLLLKAKSLLVDTTEWVSCYDLEVLVLHPMRPTGQSRWKSPMGEVSVKALDGVLEFSGDAGLDLPDSLPLPPDTPEATRRNIEAMLEMGRLTEKFLERGMGSIDLDADMTWQRRYRGVLADRRITSDQTYAILSGAQARERLVLPLYSVRADPGGPYQVTRGTLLRLDGSRSQGRDLKYEWYFGPHAPNGESGNEGATKEGQRPTTLLLDSVEVILKVTDTGTGVEDVASTTATVNPRDWETRFSHRSNWSVTPNAWQTMWKYPVGTALTAEEKRNNRDLGEQCRITEYFQAGENWCAAPHDYTDYPNATRVGIIHPHGKLRGTWLENGYAIGRVDDPGGPFDGWSYVTEHELSVERDGVFNPTLRPGGPAPPGAAENLTRANARRGRDLTAFRQGVERHEGMGSGGPNSGHSLIFRRILDDEDPAREIEKLYARRRDELKRAADKLLDELDTRMAQESKKLDENEDNQTNWRGTYYVYDRQKDEWCLAHEDGM